MGLRFRKSFKLVPGVRMNLSGGGISWTLGVPGASVGIGRRGARLNTGIPGTGLGFSTPLFGSESERSAPLPSSTSVVVSARIAVEDDGTITFKDDQGNPLSSWMIDKAKRQHGEAIQKLIADCCDKINREITALGELHLHTPHPDERERYIPSALGMRKPLPPVLRQPGFFDRIFKWRLKGIEDYNVAAEARFARDTEEWEGASLQHQEAEAKRRRFLEEEIFERVDAMDGHLEATLSAINWPRETQVSVEITADGKAVDLDVDLPEIEQLPRKTASVPARGYKLSVKEMGATQLQKLYMSHVHGIGFRIIGEAFAALPTVQEVSLSAYSQRPNKATGQIEDQYLYSVRVDREKWKDIDFKNLGAIDIVQALERFEFRRQMTKTGVFKAIEPFSRSAVTSEVLSQ